MGDVRRAVAGPEVLGGAGAEAYPETVSTVRRIAQRKLEEELEYVETDSVYSYRL